MNSFSFVTNTFCDSEVFVPDTSANPRIIEGADLYDKVAPVSSLTGRRENPLLLLQKLDANPAIARALQQLLPEIPSIRFDKRMNDEDRINLIMSRLSTGTPAEDDATRLYLESIADVLFKNAPQAVKEDVKDSISFTPSDGKTIDDGVNV